MSKENLEYLANTYNVTVNYLKKLIRDYSLDEEVAMTILDARENIPIGTTFLTKSRKFIKKLLPLDKLAEIYNLLEKDLIIFSDFISQFEENRAAIIQKLYPKITSANSMFISPRKLLDYTIKIYTYGGRMSDKLSKPSVDEDDNIVYSYFTDYPGRKCWVIGVKSLPCDRLDSLDEIYFLEKEEDIDA